MKAIAIAFVLSFVGISSARNIKWSTEVASEIAGDREFNERIHKFATQIREILGDDEQSVKEFLHQMFEIYRPIHGATSDENAFDPDMVKPQRPFLHPQFPQPPPHVEEVLRPLVHRPHERPQFFAPPVEVDGEMERVIPQKHNMMRPLKAVSGEINDQEMMKPLPHQPHERPFCFILPVDLDGDMELSIPQKPNMRPLEAVSGEVNDQEVMRPLPYQSQEHPQFYILPAEIDGDMEILIPQQPNMRPLETVSGEVKDQVMRPQQPHMRPQFVVPPVEGDMEIMIPQKPNMMRPLETVSSEVKDQEMMRPQQPQIFVPPVEGNMAILVPQNPNMMRPLEVVSGEVEDQPHEHPQLFVPSVGLQVEEDMDRSMSPKPIIRN